MKTLKLFLALLLIGAAGVAFGQTTISKSVNQGTGGASEWIFNQTKINGNAVDTNSGNVSVGTQRVVIANDQPAMTNAQPVRQKAAISTSGTMQSAATANGNGSTISTDGMASAVLTVNCSSCSGGTTVNFEGTEDGSNYASIVATQLGASTLSASTTTAGLTYWQMPVAGLQNIRARISTYSAGTVTVTAHAVPVNWSVRSTNANVVNTPTMNLSLVNGTTVDTNSGGKSAGTQRVVIANDQPTMTNPQPVTPQATESYLGFVGGKATIVSANFSRPADTTAYASGDLVANSTTAGSVAPLSFTVARINDASGMIRRVRLKKSGTSLINAQFRVHFYQNDPSASSGIANGDNGSWSTKEAGYLGSVDVTVDKAFTDGADGLGIPNNGTEINFIPKSGTQTIYALIEARGAYTPGNAEVFTLYLEALQN